MTGVHDWPATRQWSVAHIQERYGASIVSVNITPAGLGDAVVKDGRDGAEVFVKPQERRMPLSAFFEQLAETGGEGGGERRGVPYLSSQNDNLRREFPGLMGDCPEPDFFRRCFGSAPDAANLWIGDDRSVSSVHKDHYENMYSVVRG